MWHFREWNKRSTKNKRKVRNSYRSLEVYRWLATYRKYPSGMLILFVINIQSLFLVLAWCFLNTIYLLHFRLTGQPYPMFYATQVLASAIQYTFKDTFRKVDGFHKSLMNLISPWRMTLIDKLVNCYTILTIFRQVFKRFWESKCK